MSKYFADRLFQATKTKGSPLSLGIDPFWDLMPPHFRHLGPESALASFSSEVLEALADLLPVVKFQIACFERFGSQGFRALEKSIRYAHERGLIVILDAKRGDIGSTADLYAQAFFEEDSLNVDAVTLNLYLGVDSLEPFFPYFRRGKGAFALVRTSNPSAQDFQDLQVDGERLFHYVGKKVQEWGNPFRSESGYSSLGAVVGATYPTEAAELRRLLPHTPFLLPGYGAQGARAEDVAGAFDAHGEGALISSSRQILYAYQRDSFKHWREKHFAEASRAAYIEEREKILQALRERMERV